MISQKVGVAEFSASGSAVARGEVADAETDQCKPKKAQAHEPSRRQKCLITPLDTLGRTRLNQRRLPVQFIRWPSPHG